MLLQLYYYSYCVLMNSIQLRERSNQLVSLCPRAPYQYAQFEHICIHRKMCALVGSLGTNHYFFFLAYTRSIVKNIHVIIRHNTSGYWLATQLHSWDFPSPKINSTREGYMESETSTKLKHFLWRMLSNSLAIGTLLFGRGITTNA